MRIGELAKRAGVSVDAVRYYERQGLLPPAARERSGYRTFAPEAVDRIVFIKRVQALGLSLQEVGGLLDGIDRGAVDYPRITARLGALVQSLDRQLEQTRSLREEVIAVRDACATGHCDDLEAAIGRLKLPPRR